MNRTILTANLTAPVSRIEIIQNYCRGKAVLDVGCVQHDTRNVGNANWLHHSIANVAESVTGVDYLEEHVKELNERGYQVVVADVTKPLALDTQFDVIVVGNLIEHLSSFEGLLLNIRRLLKPGGCALISTANPFYRDQYFYSAFKNDIVVNPEHTCWIDPITLDQLCRRFGLVTAQVHWIKEKWNLGQVILNGKVGSFDTFTGNWIFDRPASFAESAISYCQELIFKACFPRSLVSRVYKKYGGQTRRLLYLKFIEKIFQVFWSTYRLVIVSSSINEYELFVSVLQVTSSDSYDGFGRANQQTEQLR